MWAPLRVRPTSGFHLSKVIVPVVAFPGDARVARLAARQSNVTYAVEAAVWEVAMGVRALFRFLFGAAGARRTAASGEIGDRCGGASGEAIGLDERFTAAARGTGARIDRDVASRQEAVRDRVRRPAFRVAFREISRRSLVRVEERVVVDDIYPFQAVVQRLDVQLARCGVIDRIRFFDRPTAPYAHQAVIEVIPDCPVVGASGRVADGFVRRFGFRSPFAAYHRVLARGVSAFVDVQKDLTA